jgi:arylsulfatase A
MKRRDFLRVVGAGSASLLGSRQSSAAEASNRKPGRDRPNIVLLMADDCSARELGCYGHTTHETPVLDGLARTGVMFKTCWATPICSPSRAMIMTGRYGFRTGWFHNNLKPAPNEKGGNLGKDHLIFAQLLKRAGYSTAICGKWQLRGTMAEHGFDEHCMWAKHPKFDGPVEADGLNGKRGALPGRPARYWHPAIVRNGKGVPTTEKDYGPDIFVDFLLDFARRHKDGPFLAYFPMCLTHKSWDFEANRSGYLPVPELDAKGQKTGRKVPGSLKSNVEYTDHLVGRIIRGLDGLGLRDNTVFLFTCDNGTSGYGKAQVRQERGPRVPMIVNGPGLVKPRGAVDALTDFSDILPTLCDLAGAKLPDGYAIDGRSFAPVLRGEKGRTREWIFSNYADKRMLRDGWWLLDGDGRLYDCGNRRDEQGYKDVTQSTDADAVAARERFDALLERLPGPPEKMMTRWRRRGGRARKQKAQRKRKR